MAEKMEVEGAAPEEQIYEGIDNSEVRTKYNTSAQIVNEVLAKLLSELKPGVKVVELCEKGDKMINEKVAPLYKKNKKMQKGVAFPTCININNVVCHNSPLEEDTTTIKQGDVVRIDLGAHLDGFIALAATTVIVQEGQITGQAADALAAANTALEAALRTMKPGKKNTDVTSVIEKVATTFGVNPCEGVLSHQLKRFIIDGNNVIILKPSVEHQVEEFAFQENEVYSIDIVLSTGAGKLREVEPKTTIYKRNPEVAADLKRKTSRQVYNDVAQRFATLPFTLRTLDKKTGRIGVLELFRTGMVDAFPVLCEKQGETVVQVKTTVLITSNEVIKATATPLQQFKSEKTVTDTELLSLLKTGLKIKKPSAKKAAPKAEASTTKGDAMEVESQ